MEKDIPHNEAKMERNCKNEFGLLPYTALKKIQNGEDLNIRPITIKIVKTQQKCSMT